MKHYLFLVLLLPLLIIAGCNKESNDGIANEPSQSDPWLLDTDDILYLGTEKDKIQSLDSNTFVPLAYHSHDVNEIVYAYHHHGTTHHDESQGNGPAGADGFCDHAGQNHGNHISHKITRSNEAHLRITQV